LIPAAILSLFLDLQICYFVVLLKNAPIAAVAVLHLPEWAMHPETGLLIVAPRICGSG
jgi:hypothetical protein